MKNSLFSIRTCFILLFALLIGGFTASQFSQTFQISYFLLGNLLGGIFGFAITNLDLLFKRFALKSFNLVALGLLVGYFMGQIISLILTSAIDITGEAPQEWIQLMRLAIFLATSYYGITLTIRAADELYVTIPFVKLQPTVQKKKDIIVDSSALLDPRMIDLASTGLFDHHLILPRFIIKEFYSQMEGADENLKAKAKRALEVIKKLEGLPHLALRFTDTDFSEVKDCISKLIRLARLLDANIMTSDISRIQQSEVESENVRLITIQSLANALKPLTQSGEFIQIKIQRYGKEPRQGVGYLEDGTMVVVNGGAEFIGKTIRAQVLSVKHTSSGRMIFCNSAEDSSMLPEDFLNTAATDEGDGGATSYSHSHYVNF